MPTINIFWFRRDLRLQDNAGLYHALKGEHPILPIFIFDKNILDKLEDKADARVEFLQETISELQKELKSLGSNLLVFYNNPEKAWKQLLKDYTIGEVYTNRDYEPYALERDGMVEEMLEKKKIDFKTYKDHMIFEKDEVTKDDGLPYTVFTPYSRKWKKKLETKMEVGKQHSKISYYLQSYPNEKYFSNFYQSKESFEIPSLKIMGFQPTNIKIPSKTVVQKIIKQYDQNRNFPAINGTSRLGIHFRFGTISIREKARKAGALNETYLNELIWRDFYLSLIHI